MHPVRDFLQYPPPTKPPIHEIDATYPLNKKFNINEKVVYEAPLDIYGSYVNAVSWCIEVTEELVGSNENVIKGWYTGLSVYPYRLQ